MGDRDKWLSTHLMFENSMEASLTVSATCRSQAEIDQLIHILNIHREFVPPPPELTDAPGDAEGQDTP